MSAAVASSSRVVHEIQVVHGVQGALRCAAFGGARESPLFGTGGQAPGVSLWKLGRSGFWPTPSP